MNSKIIVSKFGGSSMANNAAMLRSAKIAFKQDTNIVIVSATYGTTNKLVHLSQVAKTGNWNDCEKLLFEIEEKHHSILSELNNKHSEFLQTKENIISLLSELRTLAKGISLLKECSVRAYDNLLSVGERLSSALFTQVCHQHTQNKKVKLLDIRALLKTDSQFGRANPNLALIAKNFKEELDFSSNEILYIGQGFIGSDKNNSTTTLGRGGSDYSAALIAEAIGANTLEIWTDVAGIATTDPRLCPTARQIEEISFQEASELATYGAKVLHPTTLAPAMRADIPVFVGSSIEQDLKGTWICHKPKTRPLVRALTKRDDQVLLTVKTPKMLHAYGFMKKIFEVFDKYQVSVDSITTSEISVAISSNKESLENKDLLFELGKIGTLHIEEELTLVSLIGNQIQQTAGLATKIFTALGDINVRMICLGASEHNFCFLVESTRGNEAINKLHKHFIEHIKL
jgi:aspartate kinase